MQFFNIGQDPFATGMTNQGPWFPWYDSTFINSSTPLVQLGSQWQDNYSRSTFAYVRAGAALTVGQLVAIDAPATDTIISASSTVQVLTLNNGGLTANAEVGNMIFINDTSTSGFPLSRVILANTATTVTVSKTDSLIGNNQADPNVLPAVPANNTAISIIRQWRVRVCTATLQPIGVVLGTVTSGYYTIIQRAGYCHVSVGGTATVVGVPGVSGAAGVALGSGGTANIYMSGGAIVPLFAATSQQAPAEVNFLGS